MNERIEKLALQANAWYPTGYPSAEGGDEAWKNLVIFEKEELRKFAELIVKECVNICKEQEYKYWRSSEEDHWTPIDSANAIGKHFGVEE